MKTPKILVSACLLGCPVRYDGQSKPVEHTLLQRWHANGWLVPFCPEQAGGLPTPRPAAEIQTDGRVMTAASHDVTTAFVLGAEQALTLCQQQHIQYAILKESSPSCGSTNIYNGQFSGQKISGQGVTTRLLREHDIQVFSEHNLDDLFALLS
jgi:uncharacterized protein YbbK (DUF523 family)